MLRETCWGRAQEKNKLLPGLIPRSTEKIGNIQLIFFTQSNCFLFQPSEYSTPFQRPTRIEFQPHCSKEPDPKNFSLKVRLYNSMKPRDKTIWEIPPDCIKLDKKLGEGQFGQVWKGHVLSRKRSRIVAVKMLRGIFYILLI